MKRRFLIVTLVTALMISAVGCGGGGKNDNKDTTTTQAEQKDDSAQDKDKDKDKDEGESEAPGKAPGKKLTPNGMGVKPGTATQAGSKADSAGWLTSVNSIVSYNNVPLNLQSGAQVSQTVGALYDEGELIKSPGNMVADILNNVDYHFLYINGAFRTAYFWTPKAVVADGFRIGMTLGQLKSEYGLPSEEWVEYYNNPCDGVSIYYGVQNFGGKEYWIRLDFSDNIADSELGDDATLYEICVYDPDMEAAFPDSVIW